MVNWERIIEKNREKLLKAIRQAYEDAQKNAGQVAGDYYFQVEIDRDGYVYNFCSNGGGSEACRRGDAITIYSTKIPESDFFDLEYSYLDDLEEDDREAIEKQMDEKNLSDGQALLLYDESLYNDLINRERGEILAFRLSNLYAEDELNNWEEINRHFID